MPQSARRFLGRALRHRSCRVAIPCPPPASWWHTLTPTRSIFARELSRGIQRIEHNATSPCQRRRNPRALPPIRKLDRYIVHELEVVIVADGFSVHASDILPTCCPLWSRARESYSRGDAHGNRFAIVGKMAGTDSAAQACAGVPLVTLPVTLAIWFVSVLAERGEFRPVFAVEGWPSGRWRWS